MNWDNMPKASADFAPLGEMEIESAGSIFQQAEFIRVVSSNAGLVIAQWAYDVDLALQSIPVPMDAQGGLFGDSPQKRARRGGALQAKRCAEAMQAIGVSAAKIRPAYLRAYADVIHPRRNRKTFDPKGGI
jgi:hypothetical protein